MRIKSDYTYGIVVRVESNDIYGSWLITAEHFSSVHWKKNVHGAMSFPVLPWVTRSQTNLILNNALWVGKFSIVSVCFRDAQHFLLSWC